MQVQRIDSSTFRGITSKNEKFEIRLRKLDDKPNFHEFLSHLSYDAAYPKNIILSDSDLRPGEFRLTRDHFIIDFKGKVIGALSYHPGNEHDYHFRHGVRIHINILPEFRYLGFGSALLNSFESYAKDELFYRISTGTIASNTSAIKLFLKNGYSIEGRTKRAIKLRFKDIEEIKGESEIFVDAVLLGKWIGPHVTDYEYQFNS